MVTINSSSLQTPYLQAFFLFCLILARFSQLDHINQILKKSAMVFTLMTMFIMPYMYTCINFQIKYITCSMILLKKCFKVLFENFNGIFYGYHYSNSLELGILLNTSRQRYVLCKMNKGLTTVSKLCQMYHVERYINYKHNSHLIVNVIHIQSSITDTLFLYYKFLQRQ